MKNPEWYLELEVHKGMPFGPGDGHGRNRPMIPWCKMWKRDQWPSSGVWDGKDKSSYIWKKVTCKHCLSLKK